MSMRSIAAVARKGRACFTGFALVSLSASLAEAAYGPRDKVGNNYQQTSSTESTNGVDEGSCNGITCYVLFQRAPQQKALIVQHASCVVAVRSETTSTNVIYASLRTRKGQSFRQKNTYLPVLDERGRIAGFFYTVVGGPVMHVLKSGERAVIRISGYPSTDSWAAECSISGKLQQP